MRASDEVRDGWGEAGHGAVREGGTRQSPAAEGRTAQSRRPAPSPVEASERREPYVMEWLRMRTRGTDGVMMVCRRRVSWWGDRQGGASAGPRKRLLRRC